MGTTDQGKRIELEVDYDRSVITEVELEYFVSCGGISIGADAM